MYASACAVARAFSLFSKKSSLNTKDQEVTTVSVEFVIVSNSSEDDTELTSQEIAALDDAANGVRMAARIVDTPCSEMNVDHFLEVSFLCILKENSFTKQAYSIKTLF